MNTIIQIKDNTNRRVVLSSNYFSRLKDESLQNKVHIAGIGLHFFSHNTPNSFAYLFIFALYNKYMFAICQLKYIIL